jgi:hypothetical protein
MIMTIMHTHNRYLDIFIIHTYILIHYVINSKNLQTKTYKRLQHKMLVMSNCLKVCSFLRVVRNNHSGCQLIQCPKFYWLQSKWQRVRAEKLTSSRLSKKELTRPDLQTQEVDCTKTLRGTFSGENRYSSSTRCPQVFSNIHKKIFKITLSSLPLVFFLKKKLERSLSFVMREWTS